MSVIKEQNKMITLRRNKWLQNLIGLGTYDQNVSPLATHRIVGMSLLMGSSLIPCSISLVRFIGNVKVATELMFCAAIYVVIFCSFTIVVANRETVRGFFFEIQKRAEESEWIKEFVTYSIVIRRIDKSISIGRKYSVAGNAARNDSFYADAEAFIHKLTLIFFILTLGGSFMYGFCPFLVVFYHLAANSYSVRVWSLHYNNVWQVFFQFVFSSSSDNIKWNKEISSIILGCHFNWIRPNDSLDLMWFSQCLAGREPPFW